MTYNSIINQIDHLTREINLMACYLGRETFKDDIDRAVRKRERLEKALAQYERSNKKAA